MPKTLLNTGLVAALIGMTALPAAADRMVIDDDGWFMAEDRPTGPAIEIEDDYWRMVDTVDGVSQREARGVPGECSSLEASAGLSGYACGVLSKADVIDILADN